jgi:hypothetical protein
MDIRAVLEKYKCHATMGILYGCPEWVPERIDMHHVVLEKILDKLCVTVHASARVCGS